MNNLDNINKNTLKEPNKKELLPGNLSINSLDQTIIIVKEEKLKINQNEVTDFSLNEKNITKYDFNKSDKTDPFGFLDLQKIKKEEEIAKNSLNYISSNNDTIDHSDLMTSPSIKSTLHSSQVGDCLLVAITDSEENTMDKITTGERDLNAKERFLNMISGIEEVVSVFIEKDLKDEPITLKELKFLNKIRGLLCKAFPGKEGSVGHFKKDSNWDEKEVIPRYGDMNMFQSLKTIKEDIKKLQNILDFFKDTSDSNFDPSQTPPLKIELSTLVLEAIFGQFINDIFIATDVDKEAAELLKTKFIDLGLMATNFDDVLPDFQRDLKKGPLLAETTSINLFNQINQGTDLRKTIRSGLTQLNLNSKEIADLEKKIIDELKGVKDERSSVRGRTQNIGGKGSEMSKDLLKLRGPDKNKTDFYVMPEYIDGKIALDEGVKKIKNMGGERKESIEKIMQNIDEITDHGDQPTTILKLGQPLDSNLYKLIKNTESRLLEALETVIMNESDTKIKEELTTYKDSLNRIVTLHKKEILFKELNFKIEESDKEIDMELSDELNQLKLKIQDLKISYNDNDPEAKIKLGDLANKKSVAGILFKYNLRTLCSISGTTTDILLSMVTHNGKEYVGELLKPLLNHAMQLKKEKKRYVTFDKAIEFKNFFAKTTLFMQIGKYHSSAEVLASMLIGALTTNKHLYNDEEIFELFEVLMKDFSKYPEKYFSFESLSEKERELFFNPEDRESTHKMLREQMLERAQTNIKKGLSSNQANTLGLIV